MYEEGQLNEILSEVINAEHENYISNEEKNEIVKTLNQYKLMLDSAVLTKIDDKHFKLFIDGDVHNLIVDDGLWKINPYSYKIYE